jgi:hypothetical protein
MSLSMYMNELTNLRLIYIFLKWWWWWRGRGRG